MIVRSIKDDEQPLLLQVAGVSVRRLVRRAGVLPVVKQMMKEMMMVVLVKKRKDPSETVVHQGVSDGPVFSFLINVEDVIVTCSVLSV